MPNEFKPPVDAVVEQGAEFTPPSDAVADGGQKKSLVGPQTPEGGLNTSVSSAGQQVQGGGGLGTNGNGYQWSDAKVSVPVVGGVENIATDVSGKPRLTDEHIENYQKKGQGLVKLQNEVITAHGEVDKNTSYSPIQELAKLYGQLNEMGAGRGPSGTIDQGPLTKEIQQRIDQLRTMPVTGGESSHTYVNGAGVTVAPKTDYKYYGDMYDATAKASEALRDKVPVYQQQQQELNTDKKNIRDLAGYTGSNLGYSGSFMKGFEGAADNLFLGMATMFGNEEEKKYIYQRKYAMEDLFPMNTPDNAGGKALEMTGGLVPLVVGGAAGGSGAGAIFMNALMMGAGEVGAGAYEAYSEAKQKGKGDDEAMQWANKMATERGVTGAALGAALPGMSNLGEKLFLNGMEKNVWTKFAATNGVMAPAFGANQLLQNTYANYIGDTKPYGEGVLESMGSAVVLGGMMEALHAAARGSATLTMTTKDVFEMALSKQLPQVQLAVDAAVKQGAMDYADGQRIMQGVNEKAEALAKMPAGLTPEEQIDVAPLVVDNAKLEAQKKTVDEAFVPGIEAKQDENNRLIREKLGMPLNGDETSELEALRERAKAKGEDGKLVNPLSASEKELMGHYEERLEKREKLEKAAEETRLKEEEKPLPSPKGETKANTEQNTTTPADTATPPDSGGDKTDITIEPHGDTKRDQENKISGKTPEPLSDAGKKQATETGKQFNSEWDKSGTAEKDRVIITSPRERAVQTAELAAKESGAKIVKDPNLDTWDVGDFHGAKESDFKPVERWFAEHPGATTYLPTNDEGPMTKETGYGKQIGESFNEFAERVAKAHEDIAGNTADIKVITHGYVRKVLDAIEKNGGWNDAAKADYLTKEKPEGIKLTKDQGPRTEPLPSPKGETKAEADKTPVKKLGVKRSETKINAVKEERKRLLAKEPTSLREAILQWFVGGGKVNTDDIKRYLGTKAKDDWKDLISMHRNGGNKNSADIIAKEQFGKWMHGGVDEQGVVNEIFETLREFGGKRSRMEDELRTGKENEEFLQQHGMTKAEHDRLLAHHEAEQAIIQHFGFDKEEVEQQVGEENKRPITEDEAAKESKEWDKYFNGLSLEEQEEMLSSHHGTDDSAAETAHAGDEPETDTGGKNTADEDGEGNAKTTSSPQSPEGGLNADQQREQHQQQLDQAKKDLAKATSDFNAASKALTEDLQNKQGALFGGKEQKLFDDTPAMQQRVVEAKKAMDSAQAEVDKFQKLVDENLPGQKQLFGKDLISDGMDDLADIIGARLGIIQPAQQPKLLNAFSKIGKGLIDEGIASWNNLIDKIKEALEAKGFFDKGKVTKADIDNLADAIRNETEKKVFAKEIDAAAQMFGPQTPKGGLNTNAGRTDGQVREYLKRVTGLTDDAALNRLLQAARDAAPDPVAKQKLLDEAREMADKRVDEWIGNTAHENLTADIRMRKGQEAIKETVPRKNFELPSAYAKRWQAVDMAIHLYNEIRNLTHEQIKDYRDRIDPKTHAHELKLLDMAQNLTDAQKKIADDYADAYKRVGARALGEGVIKDVIDNYNARVWDVKNNQTEVANKFITGTGHSIERTLESTLQGWAEGMHLKIEGASSNLNVLEKEISHVIENKRLIEEGSQMQPPRSPGRNTPPNQGGDNPLFTTQQLPGYEKVENQAFKKWEYAGKLEDYSADEAQNFGRRRDIMVTENGTVMKKSDIYAPAETAKGLNKILGSSWLNKAPGIEAITKFQNEAKFAMLSLSGFHHLNFLRAHFLSGQVDGFAELNPVAAYRKGLDLLDNMPPSLEMGIKQGLTIGQDPEWNELFEKTRKDPDSIIGRSMQVASDAINKYTAGVPRTIKDNVSAMMEAHHQFLFTKLGAGLKALNFVNAMERAQAAHPNWTPEQTEGYAKGIADNLNATYGGQNLKMLRRDPTAQHIARLLMLAPDWTESNIKKLTNAFATGDKGNVGRRMWANVLMRGAAATVTANLAMALMNDNKDEGPMTNDQGKDNNTWSRFVDRYKTAWDEGRLRWTMADITPMYHRLGGDPDKRAYFTIFGMYTDPMKLIGGVAKEGLQAAGIMKPSLAEQTDNTGNLGEYFGSKTSFMARAFKDAITSQDWQGKEFTNLTELEGKDKEFSKNKGQFTKYAEGGAHALHADQMPSYVMNEVRGMMPIGLQNIAKMWQGESDGFTTVANSVGAGLMENKLPGFKAVKKEARTNLEQKISKGQDYGGDLQRAIANKFVSEREADKFVANAQLPAAAREFKKMNTESQLKTLRGMSEEKMQEVLPYAKKGKEWYRLSEDKPELFKDEEGKKILERLTQ